MKKRKVGEEGPMYTHSDFRASASVRARTAVINVKRASVLDLISQATYIRSEKFKKRTPLIWQGEPKFQMLVGLGQRLACTHSRHSVTGIMGVGRRPLPKPPAGVRMKGA